MVSLLLGTYHGSAAASEPAEKVGFAHLQLSPARNLLDFAVDVVCVCPPGQADCTFPPWGMRGLRSLQSGDFFSNHCFSELLINVYGTLSRPETSGSVTVRHSGFGLLIVKSSK